MNIKIHPVIVPNFLGITRELRTHKRHVDSRSMTPEDVAQYDCKTLFYDVFFNPKNTILYAIGPALLNFKCELPISALKLNDKTLDFTITEINPKTTVLKAQLKQTDGLKETNEVKIVFGKRWTWTGIIEISQLSSSSNITLSTIQKDNEIRWIQDWIRYYRNAHDVDRVIIYDNNSSYQSKLEEKLASLETDVLVIHWNFPYGPARSHGNQMCQLGALNHCRLKFGDGGYGLNFDIDELLVVRKSSLKDLLKEQDIVYFDSYMVPPVSQLSEDYSFSSFLLRDKLSRLQEGSYKATKYAYKFSNVYANSVHFAMSVYQKKGKYLEKVLKKLKLEKHLSKWLNKRPIVSLETAYYLHYSAITSGWKAPERLDVQSETNSLVEDYSVIDALERSTTKSPFPNSS